MEHIGYSLVDADGVEVWHVGDTKGQLMRVTDALVLPNGDQVHCAVAGDQLGEWRFVERWLVDDRPSLWHAPTDRVISFDGEQVVVIQNYEDTPSLAPTSVTPRQARLALYTYSLLDQVQAAVTAQGGTTLITWDYATYFDRNDPLITTLSTALGLTSAQIDDLFRFASTL